MFYETETKAWFKILCIFFANQFLPYIKEPFFSMRFNHFRTVPCVNTNAKKNSEKFRIFQKKKFRVNIPSAWNSGDYFYLLIFISVKIISFR